MAASFGKPLAWNVELPAPVQAARAGNLAPTVALGTTTDHGPVASTVSSKLPVFVPTVATTALTPPLANDEKARVGLANKRRASALLQKVEPLSIGQVTPTSLRLTIAFARLLTSCTAPGLHVATRWIAGVTAG